MDVRRPMEFVGVFVLQGLPCFAKWLSLSGGEIVGFRAVWVILIPTVAGAAHFMASAYGFELQEDTCVLEVDAFPIVTLLVLVSAVTWFM